MSLAARLTAVNEIAKGLDHLYQGAQTNRVDAILPKLAECYVECIKLMKEIEKELIQ